MSGRFALLTTALLTSALLAAALLVAPAAAAAPGDHEPPPATSGPSTDLRTQQPLSASTTTAVLEPAVLAPAAMSTVTITGHGQGPGRGLGQWGAYGYALQGWSYQQILAHFYGGTTLSRTSAAAAHALIRVRLFAQDDRYLTVTSGTVFTAAGVNFAAGTTASIRLQSDGTMQLYRLSGSCGGTTVSLGRARSGLIQSSSASPGNDLTKMLTICGTDRRTYRGMLTLVNSGGAARTVNTAYLHDYLLGVVPRESYASWGDGGGGKGANALRAQAVAARTYAMAESRYSYAETCDDTHCQMYGGAGLNGTFIEDPRTTDAVTVTDGLALLSGGKPVYAEFGASSGGYTAGGQFPPVPDAGDAVPGNPYHNWTRTVDASGLGPDYGIGTLTNITVTARDGRGADGGRVLRATLTGTAGSVSVTGDDIRRAFGLPSNWFVVHTSTSTGQLRAIASDTGAPVPGVRYGLYGSGCSGSKLSEGLTGSTGTFPITAYPGSYCARMEAVPAGFLVTSTPIGFTVPTGTAFTVTSTVRAGVQHGTVRVLDSAGQPVSRVVLTFFGASCTAGAPTSTVSTGADGSRALAAWPGSYCVVIRSVPAGYRFDPAPVPFTVRSQTPLNVVLRVTKL
jgi:SpoIID/LytB domain protein